MPPTTRQGSSSKIQAKLDFSPLSKDSTQAQQLPASVRHRASAVVFCSPKKAKTASTRNDAKTKLKSKDTKFIKQQELQLGPRSSRANAKLPRIDGLNSTDDCVYGSQRKSSPGGRLLLSSSQLVNGERRNAGGRVPGSSPPIGTGSNEDDNEDEDELLLPVGTRSRPQIVDDDDDDEEDDDRDVNLTLPRNPKSVRGQEGENDPVLPNATIRDQVRTRQAIDLDGSGKESTSTGSEDEPVVLSSTRLQRRSNVLSLESDEEDEPVPNSTSAPKRLRSRSDQAQTSSSPSKKRRLQQGSKPRRMTREEQDEEVLEDAQDLQDTATIDQGLRSTSKLNEKKLARQKQLSKLAARRNKTASTAIQSSSPSPEPEDLPLHRPYNDIYSDDNSSQADSLIDDDDLDAASPTSSTEEIRINRSIYDIPSALYYTIQQLLHTKFFPSKPITNPYYTAAHSLLTKRLESYANQYISSIWRKDFTAALYARPRLTWPRNELSLWDSCEACGRRDHPARYVVRFEGPCYDEQTLESLVSDEASAVFQKFDTQVPEDAVWHVGADCHDNAWRAHRAIHWRIGLSSYIDKALTMMGVEINNDEQSEKQSEEQIDEDSDEQSNEPEPEPEPNTETIQKTQKHRNKPDPKLAANATTHQQNNNRSTRPQNGILEEDEDEEEQDVNANVTLVHLEDRFQATLLQMEDQGYVQALQNEFLERFEMMVDDDDDSAF